MGWEMLPPEQPVWVSRCCPDECVKERDRLKAENERLRSALENIANTWPLDGENAHLMRDEAKQALEVYGVSKNIQK